MQAVVVYSQAQTITMSCVDQDGSHLDAFLNGTLQATSATAVSGGNSIPP